MDFCVNYWIPTVLIKNYGSIEAFPWDERWKEWQKIYPKLGIFYIHSNPVWSKWHEEILKFGVSFSISPDRLSSYNGTNPVDCVLEFVCICTDAKQLEDQIKSEYSMARLKTNPKSEWITSTKQQVIKSVMAHLCIVKELLTDIGIPLYEFKPNHMQTVFVRYCDPYRSYIHAEHMNIPLSYQEQIYVAIFQNATHWDQCLSFDNGDVILLNVDGKLTISNEVLEKYISVSHLHKYPVEEFTFCTDSNSDDDEYNDVQNDKQFSFFSMSNLSINDDSFNVFDEKNTNAGYMKLSNLLHTFSTFLEETNKKCEQQQYAIDENGNSVEILDDNFDDCYLMRAKMGKKYYMWTPKEEWVLFTGLRDWPNNEPISWKNLFIKYQNMFQMGRRPTCLSNKWKDICVRTPEKIWSSIALHKRVQAIPEGSVKRIRRKIDELNDKEVWICKQPNCCKRYAATSLVSILEHQAVCKGTNGEHTQQWTKESGNKKVKIQ